MSTATHSTETSGREETTPPARNSRTAPGQQKALFGASVAAATAAAASLLLGSSVAQAQEQTPPPPAPGQGSSSNGVVPAAPPVKTPPTPRPKDIPDTAPLGVTQKDIQPVRSFDKVDPGQPLESDPAVIRTLEDALTVAFRRNPTILQAHENNIKTQKTIDQILGGRGPQVTANVTYSRLANSSSAFGGGASGVSPGQIQNPFPPGLNSLGIAPPGSQPVQLSGNAGTGAGAGAGSAGAVSAATGVTTNNAATGAQTITRALGLPSNGVTRQEDGGDDDGSGGGLLGNAFNANQASARLTITQFIDITGILRVAEQVGDLQLALTRLELARQRQQVALDVRNGYYNVLRAQAFVRVNEAAVAQSQELVRVTEVQKSAGVAAEFDVLRARTQLENNRQALISSRNQVLIARNAFANSLGIDPSTVIELQDVTEIPSVPELNEEQLLTRALQQRPEYLQADVNIMKAQKNTRLARRTLEPFLNAGISSSYAITEPALGSDRETATFSLALGVPLWDGGATRAAVDSARADERIAAITKDQYVRGIKAEVQQAVVAVKDAAERRTSAEANVTQAREALRLAGVRFRAGVGTQLEINDAQTALTQAETNQVNAQYDYLAALARLSRAVGTPA